MHLKGLTNLETLVLYGTKINDAGLVHLKGLKLKQLSIPKQAMTDLGLKHYLAVVETHNSLRLSGWSVSDAGLVHLKGLTNLQTLVLSNTQISDAGLVHLKGMTNLKGLNLFGTKVTDAGVAELQKALPNCRISRP